MVDVLQFIKLSPVNVIHIHGTVLIPLTHIPTITKTAHVKCKYTH